MSMWEAFKEMQANQPSLMGELGAMAREAAKDINNTMHETFFGHGVGMGEPGTPLSPTQMQVNNDLGVEKDQGMEL